VCFLEQGKWSETGNNVYSVGLKIHLCSFRKFHTELADVFQLIFCKKVEINIGISGKERLSFSDFSQLFTFMYLCEPFRENRYR
jgi:hypothetical protein